MLEPNLTTLIPKLSTCQSAETAKASENYLLPFSDDGVVSQTLFRFVIERLSPLSLFVCLLSAVGGVFNVTVYIKQRRDAYAVYLLGLCFGDLVYVTALSVLFASGLTQQTMTLFHQVADLYLNGYLSESTRSAAVCLNCLASLQRLLVLAFPLRVATAVEKPRVACAVVGVVFTCSLLLNIYIILGYTITEGANGTWGYIRNDAYNSNMNVFLAVANAKASIFVFGPTALSAVFNASLVVLLVRHFRTKTNIARAATVWPGSSETVTTETALYLERNTERSVTHKYPLPQMQSSNKAARSSRMILLLTFAFMLLTLPIYTNIIASRVLPHYGMFKRERYLFGLVYMATQLVSNMTQPILFIISVIHSRQYRATFKQVFCSWMSRIGSGVRHYETQLKLP